MVILTRRTSCSLCTCNPLLMSSRRFVRTIVLHFTLSTKKSSEAVLNSYCSTPVSNLPQLTNAWRVVICKSLGGGVPLGHWNPYTVLDHDKLQFLQPHSIWIRCATVILGCVLIDTLAQYPIDWHSISIAIDNISTDTWFTLHWPLINMLIDTWSTLNQQLVESG